MEMGRNKVKVLVESWVTNCGDGCCYDYGEDVYVNGVKICDEDDMDVEYLEKVLNLLGYEVVIERKKS